MLGQTSSQTGNSKIKGEKVNISFSGESLGSVTFTITYAEVTETYTWTGKDLTVEIPPYLDYTITPGDVLGFATPSPYSNTSVPDNSRTISFNYIASVLKVNILSNQGENDSDIASVKATIVINGGDSYQLGNGETVILPKNVTGVVSFPDVEGYKKPEDISFTHTSGLTEVSGEYKCELLTVNVSADEGSISGYEVTISKLETVGIATKYTRLEYIESTGTQWINTGFKPNQDTRVVANMYLVQNNSSTAANEFFGVRTSTSSKCFGVQYNNTSGKLQYFYGNGYTQLSHPFPELPENGNLICSANKNILTLHGTEIIRDYETFQCDYDLYLFALNNAESVSFQSYSRLYSCQIYDNEILICNYIPALREDGIVGLYNLVNDTFTASNSGNNFIAGPTIPTIIATQTSVTGTYKIPFNINYSIQASKIEGYDTPPNITRIASTKTYLVTQKYIIAAIKDLSLYDIYGNSINRSTANCYIVREAGRYKFPCVYGNAIKNGKVNTAAFTNNGGEYSHDFVDWKGKVITSPYMNTSSPSIVISDLSEEIITGITLINEEDCDYVQFTVLSIPDEGGNCVIGVQGVPYQWSWNIWLWPYNLSPIEITNATGVKYNIMPVNLASKYDSDLVHIKNWFYQWGRKDPMLLPSTWNSTTDHEINYGDEFTIEDIAGDLKSSINNPSTFYCDLENNFSCYWFSTQSYYNLWDAACTGTGKSDNDTVKTIYDPCPVGWKVPNGNTFTGLYNISNADGIVKATRYSGDTVGVEFPMSGRRNCSDNGSLSGTGSSGYVWLSSTQSQGYTHVLGITPTDIYPQENFSSANGFSIRPVQDDNIQLDVIIINFTIDGITYQAESGMTWFEWVNSEYNTNGFCVSYVDGGSYMVLDSSKIRSIEEIHENIIGGYLYTSVRIPGTI